MSKKEKRRRHKQYSSSEWSQLFVELKEAYEQWEEVKQEVVEQEVDEEEIVPELDEENEQEIDNPSFDFEEEYYRKHVGPKSYWDKPYELMPRPHSQRQSKKKLSKMLFVERKTHEKYQYFDQNYYWDLEVEYQIEERERQNRWNYYHNYYSDDDYY